MDFLSRYDIAFRGLKEGNHRFVFEIDDRFFETFENSLVNKGKIKAKVTLQKQSTLLIVGISVKGTVVLMCDRCLEDFDQQVKNKSQLIVKFSSEQEELSDDLIVLAVDEHQINIAQYLYEQIILGLPMKHVHPTNKEGNSDCNPEMLEKLKQYLIDDETPLENEEPVIDERWSELKKLIDNK
jgi:uncharacterized protein